ncbi:hypothetical protein [Microbacterium mangrovi]|uniref:hypothetical protein n=1 Tax=Microbacterium mangrovi TaxID=1348253 RepID=UPI000AE01440|nr:hypothetical protein [Microbacterium mangrovi]
MSDTSIAEASLADLLAEVARLREELANHPYSPSSVQKLEPVPPVPHDSFTDTFA